MKRFFKKYFSIFLLQLIYLFYPAVLPRKWSSIFHSSIYCMSMMSWPIYLISYYKKMGQDFLDISLLQYPFNYPYSLLSLSFSPSATLSLLLFPLLFLPIFLLFFSLSFMPIPFHSILHIHTLKSHLHLSLGDKYHNYFLLFLLDASYFNQNNLDLL